MSTLGDPSTYVALPRADLEAMLFRLAEAQLSLTQARTALFAITEGPMIAERKQLSHAKLLAALTQVRLYDVHTVAARFLS